VTSLVVQPLMAKFRRYVDDRVEISATLLKVGAQLVSHLTGHAELEPSLAELLYVCGD
jgi:hypothetical protein